MTLDDSENQQLKSYITSYLRKEEQNELAVLRGGLYDDEYDDSYDEFTRMEVGTEGETLDAGKKGAGGRAQGAGLRMDAADEHAGEESDEEEEKDPTSAPNTNGAERGGDSSRGRGRGGKGAGYPFPFSFSFFFLL
jgi:hypothetical protein